MGLKIFDWASVFILPVFATIIIIIVQADLLVSILMFFGFPSLYLAIRNPSVFRKCFTFATLVSLPLSLFVDTLAAINGSWIISKSLFTFRFFGVATVEVYFFSLLWALYVILFYEHFIVGERHNGKMSSRIVYFNLLSLALLVYVFVGVSFNNNLLYIPYFYLVIGVGLVIVPLIVFLWFYPGFIRRFFVVGLYFFFLLFCFEIAALTTKQWAFPGTEFIGFIQLFQYRIPIEEVIIWMCFASASLLSYYEYFGDDQL